MRTLTLLVCSLLVVRLRATGAHKIADTCGMWLASACGRVWALILSGYEAGDTRKTESGSPAKALIDEVNRTDSKGGTTNELDPVFA